MVIDDCPNEPVRMTARTWRDRKDSMEFSDRQNMALSQHERQCFEDEIICSAQFWRDHISDKNGRRGNIPQNLLAAFAVPKATFSFAMTTMDKVGGWNGGVEWRRVGGVKIRCEYVDRHQSRTVRWALAPASGSKANAQDHHGMCELGN